MDAPSVRAFWHALPSNGASTSVSARARALGAATLIKDSVILYGGRTARDACSLTSSANLHLPDMAWSEQERASGGMGVNRIGASIVPVVIAGKRVVRVLVGNDAADELALTPRPALAAGKGSALSVHCLYGPHSVWKNVTLLGADEDPDSVPCARVGCAFAGSGGYRIFYFGGVANGSASPSRGKRGGGGGSGGGAPRFLGDIGYISWRECNDDPTTARAKLLGSGLEGAAELLGTRPAPRAFATLTYLSDSQLALVGGVGDAGTLGDLHVLHIKEKRPRWSQPVLRGPPGPLPPLLARSHHVALARAFTPAKGGSPVVVASPPAFIIYGGAGAGGEALLHPEILSLTPDGEACDITRSGSAGWGGIGRGTADLWLPGTGGPRAVPGPRVGPQQVLLPVGATGAAEGDVGLETIVERVRQAMLAADAAAPPEPSKRARGGDAAAAGRAGGEWVERALSASTIAIVLGGGQTVSGAAADAGAGGGGDGSKPLKLSSVSPDAYLLQLIPTSEIPARVRASIDAASAAAWSSAAAVLAADEPEAAGRKRSAAALAVAAVAAPPAAADGERAGGGGGRTSAAAVQQRSAPPAPAPLPLLGPAALSAGATAPEVASSLQVIMGLLGQLVGPQAGGAAAAAAAAGGGIGSFTGGVNGAAAAFLPQQIQTLQSVLLGRLQAVGSSMEAAAAAAASAAVSRAEVVTRADLSSLQAALASQVQRTHSAVSELSNAVRDQGAGGSEGSRTTSAALRAIQDGIAALAKDREAAARAQEAAEKLQAQLDEATVKMTRCIGELERAKADRAHLVEAAEAAKRELEKERERTAAAHAAVEQARKAGEERVGAVRAELDQARKEAQALRDERGSLLARLRRVEDAVKG